MRFTFWGFKLLACVYSRRWWSFHPRPPAFDPPGMEDRLHEGAELLFLVRAIICRHGLAQIPEPISAACRAIDNQRRNAFYFLGLQAFNVCLLASLVVISPQASSV